MRKSADIAWASVWVVIPPMTMTVAFGSSGRTVPECVICPPGVRVCVAITKLEAEFAVIVELSIVTTAGG
jgi:hypothetical protein